MLKNYFRKISGVTGVAKYLHRDCDGYKTAYKKLQVEVGQLRTDREGYKNAYEKLQEETRLLRRGVEGYTTAYKKEAAEVGRLRQLAAPFLARSDEEVGAREHKPSILVFTLPKSGTSYIGSMLHRTLGYDYGRNLTYGHFFEERHHPGNRHRLQPCGNDLYQSLAKRPTQHFVAPQA
jgi:hypothetical protein